MKRVGPTRLDTSQSTINPRRTRSATDLLGLGMYRPPTPRSPHNSPRNLGTDLYSPVSTESETASLSSFNPDRNFFSSPPSSPLKVETADFPELHVKAFKFSAKDDDSAANHDYTEVQLMTRLDGEYLQQLRYMVEQFATFCSAGLHQSGTLPKRRNSFSLNGEIIAEPKCTDISSKMNPEDVMCSGHSPRDASLRFNYELTDNNTAGDYPAEIRAATPNSALLAELKRNYSKANENAEVVEAKRFDRFVAYVERVPKVLKLKDSSNGDKYATIGSNLKHYLQEPESILSIIDRLKRGIYSFESANSQNIIFTYAEQRFIANLPKTAMGESTEIFTDANQLLHYCYANNIDQIHVPIFHLVNTDCKLPVMNQVGTTGFSVTSDSDLEHLCARADMPSVAFKIFRARYDSNDMFLFGLRALYLRLSSNSKSKYCAKLVPLLEEFIEHPTMLDKYKDIINEAFADPETGQFFTDYTEIEYYQKIYIPALANALDKYSQQPYLLDRVGTSNIHSLVALSEFNHELSTHGGRSIHPGANPGEFVPVATFFRNSILIIGNEMSYLAFIFHDRSIIQTYHLEVHPYWLSFDRPNGYLATQWLELIELAVLYKALQNPYEMKRYCRIVLDNMKQGRSCDTAAIAKVKNLFAKINNFVSNNLAGLDAIQDYIDQIYARHLVLSKAINNEISRVSPGCDLPRLTI